MRVLPYNRCVSTLGDKSPEEFLRLVSSVFRIIDRNSGNYIYTESSSDESPQSEKVEIARVAVDLSILPPTNLPICSWLPVRSPSASASVERSRVSSLEKCIVRGLVLSMDSESESDSESDTNSEIEDHEDLDTISTFYNNSRCSYSTLERSISNRDSEKSQRNVAVSLLEQHLDIESDDNLGGAYFSNMIISARDVQLLEHSDKESSMLYLSTGERSLGDRLIGHHLPHIISMYFEGRWLDLSPIEAVEDDAADPLNSLNIQVNTFLVLLDLSLLILSDHYKIWI